MALTNNAGTQGAPVSNTAKWKGEVISDKIKVRTTLPAFFPPSSSRRPILTNRLLIRPARPSDLEAWRMLRQQPEVMRYTWQGVVDTNLEQTEEAFMKYLPPNDVNSFFWLIFERKTGAFMGQGGLSWLSDLWLGWPEVGVQLRKEYWGQGYATEFLHAFLPIWWSLPRREVEIEVDRASVPSIQNGANNIMTGSATPEVREHMLGLTHKHHVASIKTMQKAGFALFKEWQDVDTRSGSPWEGNLLEIVAYACLRPEESTARNASDVVDQVGLLGWSQWGTI
jgi:RimJ/RimL family protein N-acetyltransferase